MPSISQLKLKSIGTRDLPHYVSEDGRVDIRRVGSLPSMRRWIVCVDGEQFTRSWRTLRDAKVSALSRMTTRDILYPPKTPSS